MKAMPELYTDISNALNMRLAEITAIQVETFLPFRAFSSLTADVRWLHLPDAGSDIRSILSYRPFRDRADKRFQWLAIHLHTISMSSAPTPYRQLLGVQRGDSDLMSLAKRTLRDFFEKNLAFDMEDIREFLSKFKLFMASLQFLATACSCCRRL